MHKLDARKANMNVNLTTQTIQTDLIQSCDNFIENAESTSQEDKKS